jgi:homogentisate 1,2-dioxygenase
MKQNSPSSIRYLEGFHNEHISECLPGAVPIGRNSPQKPMYGLYAEQINGTAFTQPRKNNYRSWLYKIHPTALHGKPRLKKSLEQGEWIFPESTLPPTPEQLRWNPLPALKSQKANVDFLHGAELMASNGHPKSRSGSSALRYQFNAPMGDTFFTNHDAEMLVVPQSGSLEIPTEFGILRIEPGEIAVIPRGVRHQVNPYGIADSRGYCGYLCENYGATFELPDLGPIGSNGLASSRDFLAPVASYHDKKGSFLLVTRFCGHFWESDLGHHPLDSVGWFGNYYPYKYDLRRFNTIGTVSFDHPDPSIFTVLTSPSGVAGQANVDFVIFPPRWMVGIDTFRPPYFHRNIMSEFMGLIYGVYDAKPAGGFEPGGASLHNCMQGHGPEADAFMNATKATLKPHYIADTLAFMFESCWVYQPSDSALKSPTLQKNYLDCWSGLKSHFKNKI